MAELPMPIELNCSRCGKLLRVAEDDAGREAECPVCGAPFTVPSAPAAPPPQTPPPAPPASAPAEGQRTVPPPAQSPFAATVAGPTEWAGQTPAPDPNNPYASPASLEAAVSHEAVPASPIVPSRLDLGEVIGESWQIFKENAGLLLGVSLIPVAINFALGMFGWPMGVIGEMAMNEIGVIALPVAYQLFVILVDLFLRIGQTVIFIKVARGQPAQVAELFQGGPLFLPVLGGYLLWSLAFLAGILLLIVPGIILGLMFFWQFYLIIERKMPVMEAFSVSREISSGNKLTMFALYIAMVVLGIVFGCITCTLGFYVLSPIFTFVGAIAYLMITGQRLSTSARPADTQTAAF